MEGLVNKIMMKECLSDDNNKTIEIELVGRDIEAAVKLNSYKIHTTVIRARTLVKHATETGNHRTNLQLVPEPRAQSTEDQGL
jgi:hypothetical protein